MNAPPVTALAIQIGGNFLSAFLTSCIGSGSSLLFPPLISSFFFTLSLSFFSSNTPLGYTCLRSLHPLHFTPTLSFFLSFLLFFLPDCTWPLFLSYSLSHCRYISSQLSRARGPHTPKLGLLIKIALAILRIIAIVQKPTTIPELVGYIYLYKCICMCVFLLYGCACGCTSMREPPLFLQCRVCCV